MRLADHEVEKLLSGETRARLPFGRQLLLYLDPFALFKDASTGPARMRELALSYNRAMRWVLLPYLRRWLLIAASLFLLIMPAEAAAAHQAAFAIPVAAIALGCCISATVATVIATAYFLLGR